MAITRAQVQVAVEKYLPRTANFSQSADLGSKDTGAIYARARKILLTSLLLDADAIFYVVYLAARRLAQSVDDAILQLDALDSVEQLRGIQPDPPRRIASYDALDRASLGLVRLSSGVAVDGVFGDSALNDFSADMDTFMREELVPNVSGGNRAKASKDIRASLEALRIAWEQVIIRRDLVFSLLENYVAEDLRTQLAGDIIAAIQESMATLRSRMESLHTEAQAEEAEASLIDLAAAEVAIRMVGGAPPAKGEIVTQGDAAYTRSSYLTLEGTASTSPAALVASGTDGEVLLDGPSAGSPLTGTHGQTVPPVSGTYTSQMSDATVTDFAASGVTVGMYLTFVDTGMTHSIVGVTGITLELSPTTPHVASTSLRYAVTINKPGSLLKSPSAAFWVRAGQGSAASTSLASGTMGTLPRTNKLSASDGTNIAASGTSMVLRPQKASGSTASTTASDIQDTSATFLTSQVTSSDSLVITSGADAGTHAISAILTEIALTTGSALATDTSGTISWYIEEAGAGSVAEDAAAGFLTDGITSAHVIAITSATSNATGDYGIASVDAQGRVTLSTSGLVHESGVSWEARESANTTLYTSSDLLAAGVVAGDSIEIAGQGTYTISQVSQHSVTLSSALTGTSLYGLSFSVFSPPGSYATTFRQSDGVDFASLGINATLNVDEDIGGVVVSVPQAVYVSIGGTEYGISGRLSGSELQLAPLVAGVGGFSGTTFTSTGADFSAASAHILVILAGTNSGDTYVISSGSSGSAEVVGSPTASSDDVYEVWPATASSDTSWSIRAGRYSRKLVDLSGSAPFTPSSVGWDIVWDVGGLEIRTAVTSYVSSTEVWLSEQLPEGSSADYAYIPTIRPGQGLVAAGRRHSVDSVVDGTTLRVDPPVSTSSGVGIQYTITSVDGAPATSYYLSDASGAAAYSASGFSSDLAGEHVDVGGVTGSYIRAVDLDSDGFFESFEVSSSQPVGMRNIAYRIRNRAEGETDSIYVPTAGLLADDTITVTGWEAPRTISSTSDSAGVTKAIVYPAIPADREGLSYSVVRGGGASHGRYVLLYTENAQISLDQDTSALRLRAAQVLIDFGGGGSSGISGSAGQVVVVEGSTSQILSDASVSTAGVSVGDRVDITIGGDVKTSYVTRIISTTSLEVSPPLNAVTSATWSTSTTSVSGALVYVDRLRTQLTDLRSALDAYVVAPSDAVSGAVRMMEDLRMDRALDLLRDGDISAFLAVSASDGSYATYARTQIQTAGAGTVSSKLLAHAVRADPSASTSKVSATSGYTLTAGSGVQAPISPSGVGSISADNVASRAATSDQVDVRLSMAHAVADLSDDETLRSHAFATFEEVRNRAIYELTGEVESGIISDIDPTLPWIARTGSARDRIVARYTEIRDALQYMLDNPDQFDDAGNAL